jgi:hypothetical protein
MEIKPVSNDEKFAKVVKDIEALARLLDNKFNIPFTKMRFGLDSLIGLIPVVGDGATATLGFYIIARAWRLGAPLTLIFRMILNLIFDLIIGAIPVVGDAFDFAYRSNAMNVRMLLRYLEKEGMTDLILDED